MVLHLCGFRTGYSCATERHLFLSFPSIFVAIWTFVIFGLSRDIIIIGWRTHKCLFMRHKRLMRTSVRRQRYQSEFLLNFEKYFSIVTVSCTHSQHYGRRQRPRMGEFRIHNYSVICDDVYLAVVINHLFLCDR